MPKCIPSGCRKRKEGERLIWTEKKDLICVFILSPRTTRAAHLTPVGVAAAEHYFHPLAVLFFVSFRYSLISSRK